MKKIVKLFVLSCLFIANMVFQSCQTEELDVVDENNSETITATSFTANLITKTCSNDGSFDNIIDKASCFSVVFPVTVEANGITIIVENIEGLETIEAVFDELEDDTDVLEITFPITIVTQDYDEVVVENQAVLLAMAQECVEGGKDDDIECIDFVYPITFDTFNIQNVKTTDITVNSDKQLRRFFKNLKKTDLVSINYPILLKTFDNEEIVVNSNEELAATIEAYKELCDEDDDNDFGDDDFDKERLTHFLKECHFDLGRWENNGQFQEIEYSKITLKFNPDGTVKVNWLEGVVKEGTWETIIVNDILGVKITVEAIPALTGFWSVSEIKEGLIRLTRDGVHKLVIRRHCQLHVAIENVRSLLKECKWLIKDIRTAQQEQKRLIGWEIEFGIDHIMTLHKGENEIAYGTWKIEIGQNGRIFIKTEAFANYPELNFNLPLYYIENERVKFYAANDGHIKLERNCDNDISDNDVVAIRTGLKDGIWTVTHFEQNQDPGTAMFATYTFVFQDLDIVKVYDASQNEIESGHWVVYRNSYEELEVILNFENEYSVFADLRNDWKLLEWTTSKIQLKHHNGGDYYDKVIFEKQ